MLPAYYGWFNGLFTKQWAIMTKAQEWWWAILLNSERLRSMESYYTKARAHTGLVCGSGSDNFCSWGDEYLPSNVSQIRMQLQQPRNLILVQIQKLRLPPSLHFCLSSFEAVLLASLLSLIEPVLSKVAMAAIFEFSLLAHWLFLPLEGNW